MKTKHIAVLLLALLSAGCTTTRITTVPAVRDAIFSTASHMVDDPSKMIALEIRSSGTTADATFIRMSRMVGPSKLAKQVASFLAKLEGQKASLLLFGPNSSKTLRVAEDALALSRGKELSKVTLLFYGDQGDVVRLKDNASEFKGTVLHVPQQSSPNKELNPGKLGSGHAIGGQASK